MQAQRTQVDRQKDFVSVQQGVHSCLLGSCRVDSLSLPLRIGQIFLVLGRLSNFVLYPGSSVY